MQSVSDVIRQTNYCVHSVLETVENLTIRTRSFLTVRCNNFATIAAINEVIQQSHKERFELYV